MGNTEGKSATARDYHVTGSPALLPGGSPLDVGCHVTSTTTNSKAEGASRGGRLAAAVWRAYALQKSYTKCKSSNICTLYSRLSPFSKSVICLHSRPQDHYFSLHCVPTCNDDRTIAIRLLFNLSGVKKCLTLCTCKLNIDQLRNHLLLSL